VAAAVLVVAAAGVLLVALSSSTAVDVAGIVALGVALVGAVAAVFYEIGASEDRAREAERRRPGPRG
jgi:hypothetical protein